MSRKLYKATFKGVRKTAKSPSYNDKDACYRWLVANSHRINGELLVYEIDIQKAKNNEETIAIANEYENLRLDPEQNTTIETFYKSEQQAFTLGRSALFSILNNKEEAKLGLT